MAKVTLTPITSGFATADALNANFTALTTAIENTLSRDGTVPNTINADIDLNSKRLLNLPAPISSSEPARLQDVQNAISGATTANLLSFTPYSNISSSNIQAAIQEEVDDLASSNGSSLIGFIQSGVGAVAKTVQTKLRESVSVKDFGAVGDGVVDDTSAIQAAINAHRFVKFPPGTYKISSALTVADNQTLEGEGSLVSVISTSVNTINAISIAANARRVHIRDLGITAPSIGASNAAIAQDLTQGTAQSVFKNIRILNFFTGILYGDLFWDSTVENVRCDNCARGAFSAGTAGTNLNVVWNRFYSEAHTVVGWQCSSVFNYNLISCNFGGNLAGNSQALIILANSTVIASGCNFEAHTVAAGSGVVRVISTATAEFNTCTWSSNSGAAATGYNIDIDNSAIVHVKNCKEISNGANLSSVVIGTSGQIIKYDGGIGAVTHSAGSGALSVGRNPYQSRQFRSDSILLSGAAASKIIYVPKVSGRVTRVAAIYPVATSADAGVAIVVKSADGVFTYGSFTSHTSQAAYALQEITLNQTAITSARPIIVTCAGGKVGAGEIVIIVECSED